MAKPTLAPAIGRPVDGRTARLFPAEGRVVKRFPAGLERELVKAAGLEALAASAGFICPAVLRHDRADGTISYRWLEGLTSLRDLYLDYMTGRPRGAELPAIAAEAGRILAQVHGGLSAAGAVPWQAPEVFARAAERSLGDGWRERLAATPHRVLHCDYGFGNVQLTAAPERRIVLLDPSPNDYLTFDPLTRGSVYLDLATMAGCFQGLVPLRYFFRLDPARMARLVNELVRGYEAASGWTLDRAVLDGVTAAVVTTYLTRRLRSEVLGRLAAGLVTLRARHPLRPGGP